VKKTKKIALAGIAGTRRESGRRSLPENGRFRIKNACIVRNPVYIISAMSRIQFGKREWGELELC